MNESTIVVKPIVSSTRSKSQISAGQKIWNLLAAAQDDKRNKSIMQNLQQFPRPRSVKANLLKSNNVYPWRKDQNGNDNESFHQAIRPILTMAQAFGILPLSNLRHFSPAKLSFRFTSIRTFYAISIIIMLLFISVLSIFHMIKTLNADAFGKHGGISAATAGAMFYTNSIFATVLFFWLTPRWIGLQKEWSSVERQLNSNKHPRPRLRWKFILMTAMIMIPALIEHILSLANNMSTEYLPNDGTNATWTDYMELYANKSHAFILSSLHYTLGLSIFLFIISKVATFTWNFTDLFIILVSTGLAERYKYLNNIILTAVNNEQSSLDWRSLREKYAALSTLVKQTDNDISPIILLSFVNNLYFICLQLLNGLSPGDSLFTSIYYFGSFAFLVGRTVAVTLLTARVNDQSKLALPVIYNCPSSSFTIETQRLQLQLTSDDVTMTGLKFFSITRNFMLAPTFQQQTVVLFRA